MSISLCMIVKNEENVLDRCLGSVKDIVDEIIIVDTGSTDSTVKIAEKYNAKIFYYKWDNSFSNARNCSIKNAAKDWILIMDADDEFEKRDTDKLLKLVNDKSSNTNVYFLETLSYCGDDPNNGDTTMNLNVRLIRNRMGYKFTGNIHEQIMRSPEDNNKTDAIKIGDIRFYHYGYLNKVVEAKDKRKRNMGLIQKELDKDPHNSFMLFNMGNEYYAMKDCKQALEYYMKSYEKFNPIEGFSSKLILRIVSCNQIVGNFQEEYKFIDRGLEYYPNFTDLEFIRGNTLIGQGKYLSAINSLKKCIEMGESPVMLNELMGIGSYRTYYVLCNLYFDMKNYDNSLYYCDKSLKSNPRYTNSLSKLSQIMLVKNFPVDEMKKRFESYFDKDINEETYLFLSDIFYSENEFDASYYYAEKAEKVCRDECNKSKIYYYEGVCLFYQKKFHEAYKVFEKINSNNFIDSAFYYIMLCSTLDNSISGKNVLIDNPKDIPDNKKYLVYMKFEDLIEGKKCKPLSENKDESEEFAVYIFNLLGILLKIKYFSEFEKGLRLLNLIEDDNVLLYLAKLYYNNGYLKLGYKEFVRSIKIYDKIDVEGLEMMKRVLSINNSNENSA